MTDLAMRLSAPFPADQIEWRVQSYDKKTGKWAMVLCYVQARAIMDRLDEVVGPECWETIMVETPNGILCRLGITFGNRVVWKEDGAGLTEFEAFKGGISGALKRAAVQWGIGRYLYDLPATFVKLTEEKTAYMVRLDDKSKRYWKPPELPKWALPGGTTKPDPTMSGQSPSTSKPEDGDESLPRTSDESSLGTEGDEMKILTHAWDEESKEVMRRAWKRFDHGQLVGYAKAVNQLVGGDKPAAIINLGACQDEGQFLEELEKVSTLSSQMELF